MSLNMTKIEDIITRETPQLQLTDIDGTILISSSDVIGYLLAYSDWYIVGDFPHIWETYVQIDWAEIRKAYKALQAEYNPINNYDMTESGHDTVEHGAITRSKTPLSDSHTTETRTINAETTTAQFSTTYDNQEPRLVSYSTSASGGYNSPSASTETVRTDLNESYSTSETHDSVSKTHDGVNLTGDEITTHDLKRSGNIGVTTTQQMLQSEYELRQNALIYNFVDTFVKRYCVYVSGMEC